jgi:hypothetical protein
MVGAMGRRQRSGLIAAWLATVLIASPAIAEDDVLLQAVGFAITGSDDAKVLAVDRAKCIFRVESNYLENTSPSRFGVFYLNNVQVDRLIMQS